MKGGQNLREMQAKRMEENILPTCACMVCGKPIEGYYARYGDKGVCSGACMRVQAKKPLFPGHSEEDFWRAHGVQQAIPMDA